MIQRFEVKIPESVLTDMRGRIKATRWPDEIKKTGWLFGADLSYMKEICTYWEHGFDWRKVEQEINRYPNFIAEIDGYKIHFLHIKGRGRRNIPLILSHGWPGSFLEMMKLIPRLTEDPEFSFDLVIPSIMGFGFSQKIESRGCNVWFIAGLWFKLMMELGYKKFAAQGGDFGAGVSTALALRHPNEMAGIHLNYIPGSYLPYLKPGEELNQEEKEFLRSADDWYNREGSYAHQHRTKPLTLAYGLNDSPVGLCAWLLEKYVTWSDGNGYPEAVFSKDEMLAQITLYWVTQSIHSSIRLYNENYLNPLHFSPGDFIHIPVGIARFHKEEPFPPRSYIERGYNVRHWSELSPGGHFAAMEQPELLANDILKFFSSIPVE